MRVLTTGAGLIGSYTAAALAARGHEVVLYDQAPNEAYVRSVVGSQPITLRRGDVAVANCRGRRVALSRIVEQAAFAGWAACIHCCQRAVVPWNVLKHAACYHWRD